MIDLEEKSTCVCKKYNSYPKECINEYEISEKGKSVKLVPKNSSEKAMAIIIDQCIIIDNDTKCDALFLYNSDSKKVSFLVELKGAGEIEKAFHQLSYTKNGRVEYKNTIDKFNNIDDKTTIQKCMIVSNGKINSSEKERLENFHKIRVSQVLHCEATTPVPNLRKYV